MKSILGFFQRLWRDEESGVSINFKGIDSNSNFTELTEEEMKATRSGSISSENE